MSSFRLRQGVDAIGHRLPGLPLQKALDAEISMMSTPIVTSNRLPLLSTP